MMKTRETRWLLAILIVYITILFIFAVLSRDAEVRMALRLDLFWGYNEPNEDILKDNLLNISCFIPIGILIGLIAKKYKIVKAIIVGLLFSLSIEFSQLIFEKGTFDVDDIFNNTLGAMIGGIIEVLLWKYVGTTTKKRTSKL